MSSIGYTCSSLPATLTRSVHVEITQGDCYALAGMHLISKLTKNWIWATFEPQSSITNPNCCKDAECTDLFGSKPVQTHEANTQLTRQLSDLMTAANLAPEWKDYWLDGLQILYTEGGQPTLLSNTIIEGENAGVLLKESSCISCHAVSSVKQRRRQWDCNIEHKSGRRFRALALVGLDQTRLWWSLFLASK